MTLSHSRRGATLVELLVAVVVMTIIGAGLVRLMSSQSRFFTNQEGQQNARRVARSGLGLLLIDLRMIDPDSGVVSASPSSITMRIPYRMGVSCGASGGATYVATQPVDSVINAEAGYSGYGYVDVNGVAHYTEPGGAVGSASGAVCTAAGVDTVPTGRVITVTPAIAAATVGTPVFLFQRITYAFAASTSVSGTRGLFRTIVARSLTEEISAPFDTAAKFAYYVPGSSTPVSNPAAGTTVLGMDLQLIGLNERNITNGRTQQAPMQSAVYFENR